ncbi:MAG: hypothetical protein Q7J48_02520 [Nocardioides sp.]|nr:hypothetical protein [Nocardioides sp.]
MMRPLELLAAEFDAAERAFLDAVRTSAARDRLATAARVVADVAERYNALAYDRLHAGDETYWMPLDDLTARTEVLAELWRDLASGYEA